MDLEMALGLLDLPRDFDPLGLKQQYRRRAKACHPDLYPGDEAATRQFQALSLAYGYLLQSVEVSQQDHSAEQRPAERSNTTEQTPPAASDSRRSEVDQSLRTVQLQRIKALVRQGKLLQAVVALDHLIQRFPQDPRLKTHKGWIYYSHARLLIRQGRLDLARKYLKAALKLAMGDGTSPAAAHCSLVSRVEQLYAQLEQPDQYG